METIFLDLDKRPTSQPPVSLRFGERKAVDVIAVVTDHGCELDLSPYSVRFECRLRDGPVTAGCEVSGSYAAFTVPPEMAAQTGQWDAYLSLEVEGMRTTTNDFQVRTIAGKEGRKCSRFG